MSSPSDPTVLDRELYAANPVLVHAGMELAGRYRLVACCGRGGIGEVWEAVQAPTDRRVAIKLLLPGWWANDGVRQRFVREGRLAGTLQHRHIAEILEVGESREGRPFIAMELLEGLPLHTVVERQGPMPWGRVHRILLQICGALDHAHSKNIVHRDVKPSNVMLANDENSPDRCKLVDFGIAKQNLAKEIQHLTGEGQMLGSPGFMSPEQLQGRSTDVRGDVYGLGCTGIYLLTGQVPFPGNSVPEMIHNALYDEPRSLEGIDVEEPLRSQVEAVLHRAVNREPDQRYPSMLDFAVALNQVGREPDQVGREPDQVGREPDQVGREPAAEEERTATEQAKPEVADLDEIEADEIEAEPSDPNEAIPVAEVATVPNETGPRGVISTHTYSPVLAGRSTTDRVSWGCSEGFVEVARIPKDIIVVQMSGRIGAGAAWLFEQHLRPLMERNRPIQLFWHLGAMQGYPAEVREASLRCLTACRECIESVHLLNGPGVVGIAVSLATVTLGVQPHMYGAHVAWCGGLDAWARGERG